MDNIRRILVAIDNGMRRLSIEDADQLCDDLGIPRMVSVLSAEERLLKLMFGGEDKLKRTQLSKKDVKQRLYGIVSLNKIKHKKIDKGLFDESDIPLLMKAGLNVPETAFLMGETMRTARDARLKNYVPLHEFPTHKSHREEIATGLTRVSGKLRRRVMGLPVTLKSFGHLFGKDELERLHAGTLGRENWDDKLTRNNWEFLMDMNNHGLEEARELLLDLYREGFYNCLDRYKRGHPELFENEAVLEALPGRIINNFFLAMDCHNNHTDPWKRGGITLGYRSLNKDLSRLGS